MNDAAHDEEQEHDVCACPLGASCTAPPCPMAEERGPEAAACACHRCEAVR